MHGSAVREVRGSMEDLKTVFTERMPLPEPLHIPFWLKSNLTVEEAAAYSGVGRSKLRELSDDENCSFVLWVGNKRLIKRRLLDEFLDSMYSV